MAETEAAGFGAVLRDFRERAALSQEELAERSGLTVGAIGSLERGVRRRPYPHTVRTLAEALGLDERDRVRLVDAVPRRRESVPDAGMPVGVVGRDVEAEHVAALVGDGRHRLVTLTGPGGVGKTTLAHAALARLAGELSGDPTVVDVSRVTDATLVLSAVARALGLPETSDPTTALPERLRGRSVLVLLDNLEQVVDCGPDLASLLEACPGLTLLATSRIPLRIRAEHEVPVGPLPVPDPWLRADPDRVGASPAVRMFLERARAMGAALEVTRDNAASVAEICRRVDGLPLALELVAGRARSLSPDTLLVRLEEALDRPGGPRDLPARQRTLTATLDWSLELLGPAERDLFAALGAFAGGFSLEAAEALVGPGPDVLGELVSLTEQSLVTAVPGPGSRHRLLEPVRQYARRLTPAHLVDAHADYYVALAGRSRIHQRGPGLVAELDAVDLDEANHRSAFGRLVETGRTEHAIAIAHDLTLALALRGHAREWRAHLELVPAEALPASVRCRRSVAVGLLDYAVGRVQQSAPVLVDAHRLAVGLGDPLLTSETGTWAALAALNLGDVDGARRCAGAIVVTGSWFDTMRALIDGQSRILEGDLDAAATVLDRSVRGAREAENPFLVAISLNMRATVTERLGDLPRTTRLLVESVEESVEARMGWPLAFTLPALAAAALQLDEPHVSGRLLGAAAAFTGSPTLLGIFPASRVRAPEDVQLLRSALGSRFASTVEAGRALDLDEVARLARTLA